MATSLFNNDRYTIQKDIPINEPAISIDSHIPVPTGRGKENWTSYPFAKMKVNDSFWVEDKKLLTSHTAKYKKLNPGKDFTCRTREYKGTSGMRCWRIK